MKLGHHRLVSRIVLVAGLVLFGFLAITLHSIWRDSERVAAGAADNHLWGIAQIEVDLQNLVTAVTRHGLTPWQVSHDAVMVKFDILWSRLDIYQHGEAYAAFSQIDGAAAMGEKLIAELTRLEPVILTDQTEHQDQFLDIARTLGALQRTVHTVSLNAFHFFNELTVTERERLHSSLQYSILYMAAIIGCCMVIVLFGWREARMALQAVRLSQEKEDELTQQNELIRQAEEIASIGHFVWDLADQRYIHFSKTIADMYGVPVERVDTECSINGALVNIHPDDRAQVAQAFESSKNPDDTYDVEYRVVRQDGTVRELREVGVAVADESGVVVSIAGTVYDISDQKAAVAEIVAAKEAAEAANKVKSLFLSSMSHELRTPLNAIIGFAQMLELDGAASLSDKQREYTGHIISSGQLQLSMVNQVLELTNIEAGKMDMNIKDIDVRSVLENCLTITRIMADLKDVAVIDKIMDEPLPLVCADAAKLEQVLLVLLGNAVKYNKKGGSVTLYGIQCDSGMLRLNVRDNGLGISPERHGEVFEPFNRLGKEALSIEGTGIGLTIAKHLIELQDGQIGVESELGMGCTFWVELPLAG